MTVRRRATLSRYHLMDGIACLVVDHSNVAAKSPPAIGLMVPCLGA